MSGYNSKDALKQYRSLGIESQVAQASPHRLIQLLLEGALARLAAAQGAIERADYGTKGTNLSKAIDIIGGLRSALNMDAGEMSENFDSLYEYMNLRLLEASAQNDATKVAEVVQLLKTIKSAWDEIALTAASSNP